jgi:hypothetical protein
MSMTDHLTIVERLEQANIQLIGLREDKSKLKSDIQKIGDALLNEATEREWCEEYNEFVDKVNKELQCSALERLENSWMATIVLNVTFDCAKNEHDTHAENIARTIYDYADNMNGMMFNIASADVTEVEPN